MGHAGTVIFFLLLSDTFLSKQFQNAKGCVVITNVLSDIKHKDKSLGIDERMTKNILCTDLEENSYFQLVNPQIVQVILRCFVPAYTRAGSFTAS